MRSYLVDADSPDNGAEYRDHDDGVVGVAEDGDDVGDEVDGDGKVDRQQPEPDPDRPGLGTVGGEVIEQPDQVGQDPQRFAQDVAFRADQQQRDD